MPRGVQHPIGCWTPQSQRLVDFISYCLNSNHYHFLLCQISEGGISEFTKRLSGGYTNYFNKRHNRSGSLFQGRFKAVSVKNYSHFLKLAVYINCNSEVHGICPADKWPWSGYLDYVGLRSGTLCDKNIIMKEFGCGEEYKNFCRDALPNIVDIKKYSLE